MANQARGASLPLYAQIARDIERKILCGAYPVGEVIPSEKELQAKYMVSRMTVRMAIAELSNKGYLESKRGVGTIVVYGKFDERLQRMTSFVDEMQRHGAEMRTSYCAIDKVLPPKTVTSALRLPEGATVYRLTRVRCAGEVPLAYSVTHLDIADLPLKPECYMDSLYAFLAREMGVIISRGEDILEAVLTDATVEQMLGVDHHCASFRRTRVSFDQANRPIEHSVTYYLGDRYKYSVRL